MTDDLNDARRDDSAAVPADDTTASTTTDTATDTAMESTTDSAAAPVQYGVGPFSIREVALAGVWLVAFVVSFFSLSTLRFESVWTAGLLWILTIAVPSVAVFLIILRRLSPDGIRRVGSLGIDQFASVAFSVSAVLWLQLVWETVAFVVADGPWVRSWVMWVEFVLMLAGVVLTVLAPILPVLGEDFRDRREVPAHRVARPTRAVHPRPKPEPRPAAAPTESDSGAYAAAVPFDEQSATANPYTDPRYTNFDTGAYGTGAAETGVQQTGAYDTSGYTTAGDDTAVQVPSDRDRDDAWAPQPQETTVNRVAAEPATQVIAEPAPVVQQPVSQQPFWALAATERDVYDAQGRPMFRIGPTAWALVIEDRGSVFVVRHEDGRIGYLHDVSGITRG